MNLDPNDYPIIFSTYENIERIYKNRCSEKDHYDNTLNPLLNTSTSEEISTSLKKTFSKEIFDYIFNN